MKTPMGGWGEMLVGVAVGIALVGGAVPLLTQPGAVTTGTPKIDVGASEGACAQIEQLDAYVNELEQSDANERDGAPERARQALEALIRAQERGDQGRHRGAFERDPVQQHRDRRRERNRRGERDIRQESRAMRIGRWGTNSIKGSRRGNEDVVKAREGSTSSPARHPVAVVCDGLGGYNHGEVAAEIAAEAFLFAYARAAGAGTPVAGCLRSGVTAANEAVRAAIDNDRKLHGMATTLSAAAVTSSGVEYINVGDSPIYLYRGEKDDLHEIGLRHNMPGKRNRLVSAVTGEEIHDISVSPEPLGLRPADVVVIASDGVDTIGTDGLAAACRAEHRSSAPMAADRIIEAVERAAAADQDNATVATLEINRRLPDAYRAAGALFEGRRTGAGAEVAFDRSPLRWQMSLRICNHSPTGPDWGFGGSGPAQLALAMLLEVTDPATAGAHYQEFARRRTR